MKQLSLPFIGTQWAFVLVHFFEHLVERFARSYLNQQTILCLKRFSPICIRLVANRSSQAHVFLD